MRAYNLYLSTQVQSPARNYLVPIDATNKNRVSWMIDWDNLFRKEQYKYKRFELYWKLTSESWTTGASDWENYTGILTCNLPSSYGSVTNAGTILGIVNPSASPSVASKSCYNIDTFMSSNGIDINCPAGVFPLTLTFYNDDSMTIMSAMTSQYQIHLQIELSDPMSDNF